MNVQFLAPEDPRWGEFLKSVPHQFYHLAGYAALWAEYGAGTAEATLIREGDDYFFLPYTLHSLAELDGLGPENAGLHDLRSPYGCAGPLIHASQPDFLTRALRVWAGAMRERQIVSGFVRLDPLEPQVPHELSLLGEVRYRGDTVSIKLDQDEEQEWRDIRGRTRSHIRQAERAGLSSQIFPGGGRWEDFLSIYYETMERAEATPSYFFPRSHFDQLAALLGERLSICVALDQHDQAVAAGMVLGHQGIAQLHLQGTRTEALQLNAAKYLVYSMAKMARAQGYRVFHLGGGRQGAADSLFQFKSNFSPHRHQFATWHVCFAPDLYRTLVERRHGTQAHVSRDFFPAYRCEGLRS